MKLSLVTKTSKLGDEIMDKFDFEGVHALMVVNNWTYRGDKEIPDVEELKSTVRQLIYTMENQERINNRCATGGFVLTRFQWDSSLEMDLIFSWRRSSASLSTWEETNS